MKSFEEQIHVMDTERQKFAKLKERAKDSVALKKVHENIQEKKDKLTNLLGEAADYHESLKEIQRDVGDCSIPKLVQQRRKELQQFT